MTTRLMIGVGLSCVSAFSATVCRAVPEGYQVTFTVDKTHLEAVQLKDQHGASRSFTRVKLDQLGAIGEIGSPALLKSAVHVALGSKQCALRMDEVQEETYHLATPLCPRQWPKTGDGTSVFPDFAYDAQAYQRSYQAPYVNIQEMSAFRAQPSATLSVCPVRYEPLANRLTIAKKIRFTVLCEKPSVIRHGQSSEFEAIMREKFINFQGEEGRSIPPEAFEKSTYLILTAPEFQKSAALNKLVEFRKQCFDVSVATFEEAGSTKEAIRQFVRQKMPTYLLLVGKYGQFPTFDKHSGMAGLIRVKSYNYFASKTDTGRLQPDIAMGLFIVEKEEDIENIVHKTLTMEKGIATLPKVFFGQGGNDKKLGKFPADHCDKLVKEVFDTYVAPHGYDMVWVKTKGDCSKDTIKACNDGIPFMNYSGHGEIDMWCHGWGIKHLDQLTNTTYPFVLGCACLTGTFKDPQCLAVNLVKHKHGPCAYIGAYERSFAGQHPFNAAFCDGIFNKKFTYGLAFVYGCNADEKQFTPKAAQAMPPEEDDMALMTVQYHLFGDPALATQQGATGIGR